MQLFNTLTRSTDELVASGRSVGLYVCGITPYDTTHLGHARTYLVFDVLVRHLIHSGMRVDYVQNITDVDESIVEKAQALGESYEELGDHFMARYVEDLAALGMIPATVYPRATDALEEMQEAIRRLLATDHAYRVDGDVYFSVGSRADYGKLSRLSTDRMLEIEAEQDATTVDDPRKNNPLDFPLWRATDDSGPSWSSPWGRGRPGWHLECSTLALRHLGRQVDIHGGGTDLIFPHHEAEIAQSESLTGTEPFARHWVHVEMARLDGEKMSKSRGNLVFVKDLLTDYSADAIRLYVLGIHYRSPLDFEEDVLRGCAEKAVNLAEAARGPRRLGGDDNDAPRAEKEFIAALEDDLDTPRAISILEDLADRALSKPGALAQKTVRSLAARLGLSLETTA